MTIENRIDGTKSGTPGGPGSAFSLALKSVIETGTCTVEASAACQVRRIVFSLTRSAADPACRCPEGAGDGVERDGDLPVVQRAQDVVGSRTPEVGLQPAADCPPLDDEYSAMIGRPLYSSTWPAVAATAADQRPRPPGARASPVYTWHASLAQMSAPTPWAAVAWVVCMANRAKLRAAMAWA